MDNKKNTLLFFFIGAVAGILAMYLFSNYTIEKKNQDKVEVKAEKNSDIFENSSNKSSGNSSDIESLTEENRIISYIKSHHELPEYYLTKSEAKKQGWNSSAGNLCDVLPGKAIGGDKFSNREKSLPPGNQYFEADVNYNCGNRGADRIVFTKNGDVWLAKNHYKSFQRQ